MSSGSHGLIQLRSAATLFSDHLPERFKYLTEQIDSRRVRIHHPDYEDADDLLLTFHALDHEEGGLHHGFVLTVCAIVAGNAEGGYLSRSSSAEAARVAIGIDEVLVAGDYYFHVPSGGKSIIGRNYGSHAWAAALR